MSCCCTTKVPLSKRVGEECERCRHATTMQHWSKPAGGLFRFLSLVCSHTLIHSGVTHWVSTQVSFASWMNEWTNEQKPSFPLPRSHPHLHSLLIGASSIWPSHTLQNLADPEEQPYSQPHYSTPGLFSRDQVTVSSCPVTWFLLAANRSQFQLYPTPGLSVWLGPWFQLAIQP